MRKLTFVALVLTCCIAAQARAEAVKSLRLVLPAEHNAVVENIGRVFVRQIESRCNATVASEGDAPLVVELAVEPGIGAEGYKIAAGDHGRVRITGNDNRGLLFGVGKFLHTSRYDADGFTPGSWRGVSAPKMPVRGVYLATHFQNYYQVASVEDVTRYIEDLSLWGTNSYLVWFGMEEFNGFDDPKARAMLARLHTLLKIVSDLGLDVSFGCIANDGFRNSPVHLRAEDSTVDRKDYSTKNGPRIYNLGYELCPSKPGVPKLELQFCREKFKVFKDIGIDYWTIWPYDNGGCTCPKCAPWGANGYLRMAEMLAKDYRQEFPKGKVILGAWYFDRWGIGEWDGITAKFKAKKPDWVDYIMADNFEEYPRYPLEHGVPGGLPMLNFPDISMYGQDPWGGYGANPHPGRLQRRWDETKDKLSGGFPYSEGIYEDINKVIVERLYWDPDRPAIEAAREYAAFEFGPDVADDVASVVKIFEENHFRNKIGPSAITAVELLDRAEAKMTPQARRSWRWRLFRIRGAVDQEMYRNTLGKGRDKVFRDAYEELMAISLAKNVWPMMRPVLIPAVNVEGPGLPAGYAKAVAASKPLAWWRMNDFRDRQIADATANKHPATCEEGSTLGPMFADTKKPVHRAASLGGGRLKTTIDKLGDVYSVEFWFYNTMPNTARPVTGYVFSRGPDGPEGTSGDSLGISGTSAVETVPPGRLFFFNGDAAKLAVGTTELSPDTWNHLLLVRDGKRVAVYLNGRAKPEIEAEMPRGYPDGVGQLFLGGRNDRFGNFQGKIAEAAVYDRALTGDDAATHYKTAKP